MCKHIRDMLALRRAAWAFREAERRRLAKYGQLSKFHVLFLRPRPWQFAI